MDILQFRFGEFGIKICLGILKKYFLQIWTINVHKQGLTCSNPPIKSNEKFYVKLKISSVLEKINDNVYHHYLANCFRISGIKENIQENITQPELNTIKLNNN